MERSVSCFYFITEKPLKCHLYGVADDTNFSQFTRGAAFLKTFSQFLEDFSSTPLARIFFFILLAFYQCLQFLNSGKY